MGGPAHAGRIATSFGAWRPVAAGAAALAFVALAAGDLAAISTGDLARRALTKPFLMPALIAFVLAMSGGVDRTRMLLIVALACSCAGDVALLGPSDRAFVLGTLAFALAHIAYIACFASLGSGGDQRRRGLVRRMPASALVYLLGWLGATAIVAPRAGALAFVVVPYSLLLTVMALCALDLVGRIPRANAIVAAIGALVFLSSDTDIALARFAPSLAPPHVEIVIMVLYLVAQALLATALVTLSGARPK